jgi:hypothetical protein
MKIKTYYFAMIMTFRNLNNKKEIILFRADRPLIDCFIRMQLPDDMALEHLGSLINLESNI